MRYPKNIALWLAGVACAATFAGAVNADTQHKALDSALKGDQRTPANVARDKYRHPAETLTFFQIEPNMTVVEIWPGGGWYTEILAPMLKDEGTLYAAHFPKATEVGYYKNSRAKFEEMLAADKDTYGAVKLTEFVPGGDSEIAPAGSADVVVTFRNVHNWMGGNNEQAAFKAFYDALKPGGVLGVVEHRAKPGTTREGMGKSGYVTQEYVIELAKNAGFVLEESSEINANPKDSADYAKGVWTLPPSLRLGDEDKDKYLAIGESDRMTLRFRKPKS
ncbi:class I SAM-dependent methyltransferase [Microbulbifer pacificus]|uniref:Methyltransferase n=1 Tax=Microbulbifer pacificus TaxID=407164 RepID=A0AAU0N1W8_9GAMM|nr:methyltransferase [Microbulbifer pacificus]WOX06103.1 methyltransferase [Microbulbifer pacificus]